MTVSVIDERAVAAVVEESARVVEELAQGDPIAVWDDSGQPTLDRVVECELVLAHEL